VIALLLASGKAQEPGSSTLDFDGEGTFDMNPGMGLRLEQRTIDSFKRAMNNFLPHYFDYDYKYPTELHYAMAMFYDEWIWKVDFTNIVFEQADLDI
jgi:hypothetical protein